MNHLLAFTAILFVRILQTLPIRWVAWLGRTGGHVGWWLDRRHRRVALANLARAFPELPPRRIRALAAENFRRLGETYACGIGTSAMSPDVLRRHVEVIGLEKLLHPRDRAASGSLVVAIGHFGNFELFGHLGNIVPGIRAATTYRALRQPALNRVFQALRERSGCLFFERRRDGAALKAAMSEQGIILGLLADQHAGDKGLRLPFLGRECSTSSAPALFALRYHCPLFTAICYRVAPARWQIEVGDQIPTRGPDGRSRPLGEIMKDVNAAYEVAVRRDPANWFWVHRRWKPAPAGRNAVPTTHPAVA